MAGVSVEASIDSENVASRAGPYTLVPPASSVVARMLVAPLAGDVVMTTGRVVSALALGATTMVTLAGQALLGAV